MTNNKLSLNESCTVELFLLVLNVKRVDVNYSNILSVTGNRVSNESQFPLTYTHCYYRLTDLEHIKDMLNIINITFNIN